MSFFRSSQGRLLFALRGRIPRVEFWVGLVIKVAIIAFAILLHGHRGNTHRSQLPSPITGSFSPVVGIARIIIASDCATLIRVHTAATAPVAASALSSLRRLVDNAFMNLPIGLAPRYSPCPRRSIFAAIMKSFSCRPLILWV